MAESRGEEGGSKLRLEGVPPCDSAQGDYRIVMLSGVEAERRTITLPCNYKGSYRGYLPRG